MGPNEMVYIVDDDLSVGEALSTLLRANGRNVRIFTSGRDFLDFERNDACACLILDLRMPGLNGLEVQKLISAETTIPVIFITGRGDIPSTVRAMKGGAIDFLTKPIDEAALLTCIERALEQDRLYRKDALERASLLEAVQLRQGRLLGLVHCGQGDGPKIVLSVTKRNESYVCI
jgi:FixJ family two-component response regulator